MNPDRMTIAVRRRTFSELYDLAFLVLRRHPLHLLLLTGIGCGPWALLDGWLLLGRGEGGWTWYPLALLALIQAPFATGPITAYLGQAMFDPSPSPWRAWLTALRSWWPLTVLGLGWGLMGMLPILLLLASPHAPAVILLEQQRGMAAWRRAAALRQAWSGTWVLHLALLPGLLIGGWWLVANTLAGLGVVLHSADPWPGMPMLMRLADPAQSLLPAMVLFLVLSYLAIVHFLSYLDLRTEREGWDIDLGLRRAAARVGAA